MEISKPEISRPNNYSRNQLNMMSKEELINIILNQQSQEMEVPEQKTKKQKIEVSQELDWSKYSQRHIALKFAYLVSMNFQMKFLPYST